MIKKILEKFKNYWGYFMTVVAAVTFIWTLGVKSEQKNNEKETILKEITEIKTVQSEDGKKIDSILFIVNNVNVKQKELIESQNSLRISFIKYISNDDKLSKKDFLNYMQGIEWAIKSVEEEKKDTLNINPKIVIRKIK